MGRLYCSLDEVGVEACHFTASSWSPQSLHGARHSVELRQEDTGGLELMVVTVLFPALVGPFTKGEIVGRRASPAFPGTRPAGLGPRVCGMPGVGSMGT